MTLESYFPIFIQVLLAIGIGCAILFASYLLGQRAAKNPIKDSPYECGMLSDNNPHPRFSVKFYVAAMLFILFDIEVVFLIPASLIYRDFIASNISLFLPLIFFLIVLTLGLFYELKKGALNWDN